MRRATDEAPGELDDRRTPTLEDIPDLWGELVMTANLPVRRCS